MYGGGAVRYLVGAAGMFVAADTDSIYKADSA